VEFGLFITNKKLFKTSQMRFLFMLHCKTNNRARQVGSYVLFSAFGWFLVAFYVLAQRLALQNYYRNLARFIESSAGKNQWLFYA